MAEGARGTKKRRTLFIIGGIVLSALVVCCVLWQVVSDREEDSTVARASRSPAPTSTTQPSRTPRPTETATPTPTVTPTLTFGQQVEEVVKTHAPAGGVPREVHYGEPGGGWGVIVNVTYLIETLWDDKSGFRVAARSLKGLAPGLFELHPEIDILNVSYETTFMDKYGKESHHWYVRAQVSRETSEKIVWQNVQLCNFPDILDAWKVYVPLADAWQELCSR